MPQVLQSKTAGQRLSSTGLEVPERHSDTEEVTGSNPVRPTIFECMSHRESQNESQTGSPGLLRLGLALAVQDRVHRGGAGLDDGPELVPVDRLGDDRVRWPTRSAIFSMGTSLSLMIETKVWRSSLGVQSFPTPAFAVKVRKARRMLPAASGLPFLVQKTRWPIYRAEVYWRLDADLYGEPNPDPLGDICPASQPASAASSRRIRTWPPLALSSPSATPATSYGCDGRTASSLTWQRPCVQDLRASRTGKKVSNYYRASYRQPHHAPSAAAQPDETVASQNSAPKSQDAARCKSSPAPTAPPRPPARRPPS
jgi:hypothetical protein